MRRARVRVHGHPAAVLIETERHRRYRLDYDAGYVGPPVSLTLPIAARSYEFDRFPPFFDGLLPEGGQLEALLQLAKIDSRDLLAQLITVGGDLVGAVTVEPLPEEPDRDRTTP